MNNPNDQNRAGRIIFLNGTSCAGKTTLARALQQKLTVPHLHVGVDQFMALLPPLDWRDPDNYRVFYKLVSGMHHCVATLADAGNHVIVDTTATAVDDLADQIVEYHARHEWPQAFRTMRNRLEMAEVEDGLAD